ncbi:hypothetical protein FACS18945_5090 [Bacteroidia bacterium]|nr:hypothetical protein FACS18945_5090 [Bacteroidia bacterium]
MNENKITKETLVSDLKALGIQEGDILNVKISFKSIGKIEGGVDTLIDALLETVGKQGTIISDAFVKTKLLLLCQKRAGKISTNETPSYAGLIANTILKNPLSKRSPHPVQKFAAIGREVDIVLLHDANSKPYSVLHKMAEMGAKNLRVGSPDKVVGVGTTHVAIDLLRYKQNILKSGIDYYNEKGELKTFVANWSTGCRKSFNNLLPLYEQNGCVLNKGKVGNSEAMLTDMQKTLEMEMNLGKENPNFVMCNDPCCYKCRITWEHSSGTLLKVVWANLRKGKKKNFENIITAIYLSIFKNWQPAN